MTFFKILSVAPNKLFKNSLVKNEYFSTLVHIFLNVCPGVI